MVVTSISKVISFKNNNTYIWFECEKNSYKKGYCIIIKNKELQQTSYDDKTIKMIFFSNEEDYNRYIKNAK